MIEMTAERVRHLFAYDPATGEIRWRVDHGKRIKAGQIAGSFDDQGYRRIRVDGRDRKVHRLAWLYVHGQWPIDQIDHIDGDRSNNAIANLREATNAQNNWNANGKRIGVSGLRGVKWSKKKRRWEASITVHGKTVFLGVFGCPEEAGRAYAVAKADLHGEFAKTFLSTTPAQSTGSGLKSGR